jgi:homoserine kinase
MSRPSELVDGAVQVRVPASSANLGPGFDALGVALGLHDHVSAEVTGGGSLLVECAGEGADQVPRDASHLVHRSMALGFEAMDVPLPVVRLVCRNAIPHGRGLGSSSAAIVAGLAAARALVRDGEKRLPDDALFGLAAAIEGHPDNVAPAVHGGFTIAYAGPDGGFHAVRLDVDPSVAFVVHVPPTPLETQVARGLLPAEVPHRDAARNAGRSALLVAALTGRPDQLMAATEDRLHQQYRAAAMPESARLVERLRSAGLPAVVSGAGPTVLAMVGAGEVADALEMAPRGWRSWELPVDHHGVRVVLR